MLLEIKAIGDIQATFVDERGPIKEAYLFTDEDTKVEDLTVQNSLFLRASWGYLSVCLQNHVLLRDFPIFLAQAAFVWVYLIYMQRFHGRYLISIFRVDQRHVVWLIIKRLTSKLLELLFEFSDKQKPSTDSGNYTYVITFRTTRILYSKV